MQVNVKTEVSQKITKAKNARHAAKVPQNSHARPKPGQSCAKIPQSGPVQAAATAARAGSLQSAAQLAGALGLCRRAGALAIGFDAVCQQAKKGKACLVLLAQDASPRTRQKVQVACQNRCLVRQLPLTQQQLVGIAAKPVVVFAVLDENLALLCQNTLNKM